MKRRVSLQGLLGITSIVLLSCLDPYQPPSGGKAVNYLVIDGFANSTDAEVTIKVSRAIGLGETTNFPTVDDASIVIEDENGTRSAVPLIEPGVYKLNKSFDLDVRYQVQVVTSTGKEYKSEFITLQRNTDIDSVTYKTFNDHLEVYSNTHDFSEGKKYYYYTYEETYEYSAQFFSSWMFSGNQVIYRPNESLIYTCWLTTPSTNTILATTESLSQNIIANNLLVRIQKGDKRLWKKYSLLAKQTSLNRAAYEYWSQIQKMTESLGGLFDPLPYSIKGNISSVINAEEPVLGFFSGGEVTTKRIVIENRDLPDGFGGILQTDCVEKYVPLAELNTIRNKNVLLTRPEYMGIFIVGYYYSDPKCIDCQLAGGTNIRPPFMN